MTVIRLQRRGTTKVPHHRIVVCEKSAPQNGRVLEILGHYDPSKDPAAFVINEQRMIHWITSGSQVTDAVANLVRRWKKPASKKAAAATSKR